MSKPQTRRKTIQDLSPIEGVYSDFVLLKNNKLVSIIEVPGINFDLLAEYEQNRLFEDYGAYLAQNSHYNIQELSSTIPVDMKFFNMEWKRNYIEIKDRSDFNEHRKQLVASYVNEFSSIELNSDLTVKQHSVVITEKLNDRTLDALKNTEQRLREKVKELSSSLKDILESYDIEPVILNAKEILLMLHRLFDFKDSIYR